MPQQHHSLPLSAPEELADRCGPRLLRAARFLCRDESDAQDLVQEAFARALAAESTFRGDSSLYTWLYAILRRLLYQRQRKRRLHRLLDRNQSLPRDEYLPEAAYDADSIRERVEQALFMLSAKHREILLLRYVEGEKIAGIASLLGISPGTVKSRLHHAVRCLQRRMGPIWDRMLHADKEERP